MKPFLFFNILGAAIALWGCDPQPARQTEAKVIDSDGSTDTGELFALTPEARRALEVRAKAGDGAAAYRISQHYGMGGGDSGLSSDPMNSAEETRWLKQAAGAGFELAKFELAVKLGREDCAAARRMLADLVETGSDASLRKSAQEWLNGEYLCG